MSSTVSNPIPRIALTPGEPAGIGPDLCVQLAQQPHDAELVAVADPDILAQRARRLGLPLALEPFNPAREPQAQTPGTLKVLATAPVGTAR